MTTETPPSYKRDFIDYALRRGVLRFGDFTLKSGRRSPYFFNSGLFDSGASALALARWYAAAIAAAGIEYDMLFGPAYKGIPLASTLAVVLAEDSDIDVPFAFDRKEAKDHGEGGVVVGAPLAGRVLVIDDVVSAGTSTRHSLSLIRGAGAECAGLCIALDRQERGTGARSAAAELEAELGVSTISIATLDDLVGWLESARGDTPGVPADALERMRAYRAEFGADA